YRDFRFLFWGGFGMLQSRTHLNAVPAGRTGQHLSRLQVVFVMFFQVFLAPDLTHLSPFPCREGEEVLKKNEQTLPERHSI
ncbi:MAG: hypothetical protein KAQ78_11090, partial [Candidatus Latescibacteria bacterium]|nr:hypothetical protein [Candidatus Latescibacterota bacterium]